MEVVKHPLAEQLLTMLRDKNTDYNHYRYLTYRLTTILALDATRNLPLVDLPVETPLESFVGKKLKNRIVVIAILRAGLGMVQPILDIFPDAAVGYIGMERDEKTAVASSYYCKLPDMTNSTVLVVDPMLATGGSAKQTLEKVFEHGAKDVRFLSMISAPEGVAALEERFPNLPIYTTGLDRELNEKKYILPGLGDYGDRLYGTN